MRRLLITDLRQLLTILYLLRELSPEPALTQLLRDNVRQDFTGCPLLQVKPAGACLMEEHMLVQEEDTAAVLLMVILIILLCQLPEEHTIIVAVRLGILFCKDALMALVREAIHGTDQNARHSPPQAILEEAAIVIPPI